MNPKTEVKHLTSAAQGKLKVKPSAGEGLFMLFWDVNYLAFLLLYGQHMYTHQYSANYVACRQKQFYISVIHCIQSTENSFLRSLQQEVKMSEHGIVKFNLTKSKITMEAIT